MRSPNKSVPDVGRILPGCLDGGKPPEPACQRKAEMSPLAGGCFRGRWLSNTVGRVGSDLGVGSASDPGPSPALARSPAPSTGAERPQRCAKSASIRGCADIRQCPNLPSYPGLGRGAGLKNVPVRDRTGSAECSCPRPDRQCRMAKAREAAGRSGHQVEVLGFDRTRGEAGACEMVGREPGVRGVRTGGMQVRRQTPGFKWNLVPLTLVFLGSPTAALGAIEDCRNPIEVEIRPDSGVTMKFCEIPTARGVLIGSRNGEKNEKPVQRRSFKRNFHIGQFEVTQLQYKTITRQEPWRKSDGSTREYVKRGDNYPVNYVAYYEARAFVNKLTQLMGDATYRLPTEAEWEYAARGRAIVKSGVRRVGHATALLSSVTSMPSLNLMPSMTLPSCRKPRSRRQDFSALMPIL